MVERPSSRAGGIAAAGLLVVVGLFSVHCTSLGSELTHGDEEGNGETTRRVMRDAGPDERIGNGTAADTTAGDETETSTTCTHDCATEGDKRCSPTTNAGTEICTADSAGCRKWTAGTDCATDTTCDKTANDGSCVAGCVSDPGCSAANVEQATCSANGTSEKTCKQEGACFVFKTTRTGILQECTTPLYCGKTLGQRMRCETSTVGACTAHDAVTVPCPAGTACTGLGQCTATCTNACTKGATRCVSGAPRSTEVCTTAATGCTVWTAGTSCSPDSTCSNGSCS